MLVLGYGLNSEIKVKKKSRLKKTDRRLIFWQISYFLFDFVVVHILSFCLVDFMFGRLDVVILCGQTCVVVTWSTKPRVTTWLVTTTRETPAQLNRVKPMQVSHVKPMQVSHLNPTQVGWVKPTQVRYQIITNFSIAVCTTVLILLSYTGVKSDGGSSVFQ